MSLVWLIRFRSPQQSWQIRKRAGISKKLSKMMCRKWRCEQAAGGPRGPPSPFPAVCPCEGVCAAFPRWVASLPQPASQTALLRPVSQICGEAWEKPGPLGRRGYGGRKRCWIKSGGRAAPPARFTPSRNAGRDSGLRGFSPGVNAGVRFEPRGSGLPPHGRNCPPLQDF